MSDGQASMLMCFEGGRRFKKGVKWFVVKKRGRLFTNGSESMVLDLERRPAMLRGEI